MGANVSSEEATPCCSGACDSDGDCCNENHKEHYNQSDGHQAVKTHEPIAATKRTNTTTDGGEERKCDLDTQTIIAGSLFLN